MKKILGISLLLIMFAACSSNNTKDYIEDFTEFTEKVKENHAGYTAEDWRTTAEEFKEYLDKYNYYKNEMSNEEKNTVRKLRSSFVRQFRTKIQAQ